MTMDDKAKVNRSHLSIRIRFCFMQCRGSENGGYEC